MKCWRPEFFSGKYGKGESVKYEFNLRMAIFNLYFAYDWFLWIFHVPDANERLPAKKTIVACGLTECLIYAVTGAIGIAYMVDKTSCNLYIPLFLVLFGWPNVFLTLLRLLWPIVGGFTQAMYTVTLLFYGSFAIFPVVSLVQFSDGDGDSENYCHPFPFVVAYTILVIKAAWFVVLFMLFPICVFLALCVGLNQAGYGYTHSTTREDIPI